MRYNKDLCDVTIVSEDGEKLEAQKVILLASSPVLKDLIKFNKDLQPLIILEDFNATDLNLILDFIYHGEANICLENLENFLDIAEAFQLLNHLEVGTKEKDDKIDKAKTEAKWDEKNQGQKLVECPRGTLQDTDISKHEMKVMVNNMKTEEPRMDIQLEENVQIKKLCQNIEE